MRIAIYVETDEDGPGERELLLTAYVDDDSTEPRMRRHEHSGRASTPSRVVEFLNEVLGSLDPTAGP